MIDLHMHTTYSDGALIPVELTRRMRVNGCRAIAITDHVDISNVDSVTEALVRFVENGDYGIRVLPGVEITHVPPGQIAKVAERAREAGAKIINVHGETIVEPVEAGTNEAAIDAGVDILVHPGLIPLELARKAAATGVALEISGRCGAAFTNGHVARMGIKAGAMLVFNSDTHAPRDIMNREMALNVLLGAGLDNVEAEQVFDNSRKIVEAKSGAL